MSRIFISYARRDIDAVRMLAGDLRDFEYDVWFDQEITGGRPWWEDILRRIRDCDVFLFAVTPESLKSEACMEEFEYARRLGRSVLPILMSDSVKPSHLPSGLGEIQYVNCSRQDKESCKNLVKAIRHLPSPEPLPDPLPEEPEVPRSYLTTFRDRISSRQPMSLDEQSQIVQRLRWRLEDPEQERSSETEEGVRELLHLLLQREDLFAKVADDARSVLARNPPEHTSSGARAPAAPVQEPAPAHPPGSTPGPSPTLPGSPGPSRRYDAFADPSGTVEVVKRGWSWPASLLTWIWAFAKGLWVQGIVSLAISLIGTLATSGDDRIAFQFLNGLVQFFIFGAKGNSWRTRRLLGAGYTFKTTVAAKNVDMARMFYSHAARA